LAQVSDEVHEISSIEVDSGSLINRMFDYSRFNATCSVPHLLKLVQLRLGCLLIGLVKEMFTKKQKVLGEKRSRQHGAVADVTPNRRCFRDAIKGFPMAIEVHKSNRFIQGAVGEACLITRTLASQLFYLDQGKSFFGSCRP
jgi:hypothetical protein